MRSGSAGNNSDSSRGRSRGAIRTHLGRKRTGPRRNMRDASFGDDSAFDRRRQEALFDKMRERFEALFQQAGETTLATIDRALDTAFDGLVAAGEFTADNGERVRQWLKRDILHRDNPELTFRTGDITTAGTLTCSGCGWTILTSRTTALPACPQCSETSFRKVA
jgi:isocitrate dehydrogenase